MAYERLNLQDGDKLKAEHLEHIEDGISDLSTGKLDNNQGTANAGKFLGIGADGKAAPVEAPSGGVSDPMKGATASAAGAAGLVPAPAAGDQGKVLYGDGTWKTPPAGTGGGAGTGDYIPVPATAKVGQTIRVSAVDGNGKPTAWEAVDMASGGGGSEWELINEVTTTEDVSKFEITKDTNGNSFDLLEIQVDVLFPAVITTDNSTLWYWYFAPSIENYFTGDIKTGDRHISLKHNAKSKTSVLFSHNQTSGVSSTHLANVNGGTITQFRLQNWSDKILPTGTTVRVIGRRKS